MAIFNSTIINVSIPTIVKHIANSASKSDLLISGYTLAMAIMLLSSGVLAKKYGYKTIYLIGAIVFTIGALMCSISSNIYTLIAMRMVQGAGSGAMISLSMSIIGHNFNDKQRGIAVGLWVMATGIGGSVGAILGGYLIEIGRWDWIFKINVPLGLLLTALTAMILKGGGGDSKLKFDIKGFLLLLVWAPLTLYVFSRGVDMLIISITVLALGLFIKRMITVDDPLVDLKIFKHRSFTLAFITICCFGVSIQGGGYIFSQYLLQGAGETALQAGITFAPVGIIMALGSPLVGAMTNRYGNKTFILMGLVVTVGYLIASAQMTPSTSQEYITFTIYLRAIGAVLALTPITNLSYKDATSNEIESVSGVITMSKQLSGSLSITATTAFIVSNQSNSDLTIKQVYTLANNESFEVLAIIAIVTIIALILIKKKKVVAQD